MDSLKKVTKGKGNAVVPSESKNEKSKNVVNKNIKEGAKDKKNLPPKKQHEEEEDDDEEEEEDIEEDIEEEEEEEGEENGDDDDVEGDQDDEEDDDGEDGENGDDNEDDDDDDEEEDEDADSNPKKRKQSKVSLDANPNNKKQQGNTATLILLGFPFEATEEQLREFLAPCGKIHSLTISETRRGTAKAVIDRQSLEKGLELNKKYIGDRFVVVREYTDEPRSKSNDNNGSSESKVIFVGNLGSDADESEIRELFEECGEIKGIRLGKDRETGEFKGYAYVEFDNSEAPKKAMDLNGNDFNGKSIKVDIDRKGPKKDGFGGGRGRGFGGRGGGRGFGGDRRGGGGFRGGRGFGGDRRGGGGRDFGGERRFGGDGERRGGGGFRGGRGFGGDRRGGGGGFRGGRGFGGDRRGGGGRDF